MSEGRGEKFIKFIEQLKTTKSKGKLKLSDWQKQYVRDLLHIDPETGERKHRKSMLFVPRKNGKSTMVSALALAFLFLDGHGLEIVCAAASRDQAAIIFDEAAEMARRNPTLAKRLKIRDSKKTIFYPATQSKMRVVSSEADLWLGMNASHIIADEVQVWPSKDLWEVLLTSQGTRSGRLAIAIGTAGVYEKDSLGYTLYEHAKKVQADPKCDPTFLPCLYEMDPKADHTSPEVWKKVNPNYGVTLQPSYFKDWMLELQNTPSSLNAFLRWHMNVWTAAESRWFPLGAWSACGGDITLESLRGKQCWCGLDLAATSDLCAFVMVFPLDDGRFAVVCEFWCPGDNAAQRQKRDRANYLDWADAKHIHLTDGNVVDYAVIRARINELKAIYQIREIGVDMLYQGMATAQQLQADGFRVTSFGQGWRSMAAPTRELENLVTDKKLIHFNNPVLSWNADNAVTVTDDAMNRKISKTRSREKVDGLVALVMGLGCAMNNSRSTLLLKGDLFI